VAIHTFGQKGERLVQKAQAIGGVRFDWAVIGACTWLIIGAYSDVWAHNHLPIDNFFTPWHGLLYSGYLVTAALLLGTVLWNRLRGSSLWQAIPKGYEFAVLGAVLFIFWGVGDMTWHIVFGIEKSVDAALSPTHIGLAITIAMILSGPFRAAWQRQNRHSRLDFIGMLPMLLSLTYTLAIINVLAEIGQPFMNLWPTFVQQDPQTIQSLAIVSMIFETTLLMGWILLTLRRWTTPFGAFTLVFTLYMAFVSVAHYTFIMILVALLAGLITDTLVWRLQPSVKRLNALRLFAFLVPVALFSLYFLSLLLTTGINWSVHLWMGSIFVSGLTGLLLSYLLVPPQLPTEAIE